MKLGRTKQVKPKVSSWKKRIRLASSETEIIKEKNQQSQILVIWKD